MSFEDFHLFKSQMFHYFIDSSSRTMAYYLRMTCYKSALRVNSDKIWADWACFMAIKLKLHLR